MLEANKLQAFPALQASGEHQGRQETLRISLRLPTSSLYKHDDRWPRICGIKEPGNTELSRMISARVDVRPSLEQSWANGRMAVYDMFAEGLSGSEEPFTDPHHVIRILFDKRDPR